MWLKDFTESFTHFTFCTEPQSPEMCTRFVCPGENMYNVEENSEPKFLFHSKSFK